MIKPFSNRTKSILFILQLVFVGAIFVLWFGFESLRASKNLWILFLCAFPSNFISGVIPYDPMIVYFAQYHPTFYVVLIGTTGTLLVEAINYSVFKTISNVKYFKKIRRTHFVKKVVDLFDSAPFLALLIAGFLPLPFYPFRILVILSKYPLEKYILTILISKTLRMSCLVLIGHQLNIPDYIFYSLFIGSIIIAYVSVLIKHLLSRSKNKQDSL